jgi:signal transduction histidine kinase
MGEQDLETFPVPADEEARLRSLAEYHLIGTPPPRDLSAIVELAAHLCDTPNAAINIISATEQRQLAAVGAQSGRCDRRYSMCAVSITEPDQPIVVADASVDPRFAGSPFVTGEFDQVRCYAAAVLRDHAGHALGTLVVFDRKARELSPAQVADLNRLARLAVDVLDLQRTGRQLRDAIGRAQLARRELARSNAALQHFAGQVSHDLKNPLTGVLGFVAMLSEIPSVAQDTEAQHCIDRALSSATRMWHMIEDVLSIASAGGRPTFSTVQLNATATQVLEDLSAITAAAGATVHVGALPAVTGDATQLRQLLQNLVSNSLKFRDPHRPCRIEITGDETPDAWTVSVADNGVGIPPADRPRVLEMFTRLRTDIEGAGIGLATCQRIVEAHGASIAIDETPGGGTTVIVTLPKSMKPSEPLLVSAA